METETSYSIFDIKEADPQLEKHRREVIEKYLEYGVGIIQRYIDEGKNINELLDTLKNTLWYLKNERAEKIDKELGISS